MPARLLVILLILAAGACRDALAPLPDGARAMDPLPVYAEWWRMTEECSGRRGRFADVQWYVMPDVYQFTAPSGETVAGYASGNRIVVAGGWTQAGPFVRHEMLHVLLRRGGHPRDDFVVRCGTTVSCDCYIEGEAVPASGPGVVSDSVLEVSIGLWPATPSFATLGGYFRITLTARNPLAVPVIVEPRDGPETRIKWRFTRPTGWTATGGTVFTYAELKRFAPGESKHIHFDFWIGGTWLQEPFDAGTHLFTAAFGRNWAAPLDVTIAP